MPNMVFCPVFLVVARGFSKPSSPVRILGTLSILKNCF